MPLPRAAAFAAENDMEVETVGGDPEEEAKADSAAAMSKMAYYMQSTQAAALRAADAQARVQKFLADKTRQPSPVITKPKTPVVMRHSQQ